MAEKPVYIVLERRLSVQINHLFKRRNFCYNIIANNIQFHIKDAIMVNILIVYDDLEGTKETAICLSRVLGMCRYLSWQHVSPSRAAQYGAVLFVTSDSTSLRSSLAGYSWHVSHLAAVLLGSRAEAARLHQQAHRDGIPLEMVLPVERDSFPDDVIAVACQLRQEWQDEKGKLPHEVVRQAVEQFLTSHNTASLATGSGTSVRCTPIEYIYREGKMYLFSEGGLKFANLYRNRHVSLSVYDPFTGLSSLSGMQLTGTADWYGPGDKEYEQALAVRHLTRERVERMPVVLHALVITLDQAEFLWHGFSKQKGAPRQYYRWHDGTEKGR